MFNAILAARFYIKNRCRKIHRSVAIHIYFKTHINISSQSAYSHIVLTITRSRGAWKCTSIWYKITYIRIYVCVCVGMVFVYYVGVSGPNGLAKGIKNCAYYKPRSVRPTTTRHFFKSSSSSWYMWYMRSSWKAERRLIWWGLLRAKSFFLFINDNRVNSKEPHAQAKLW